MCDQGCCCFNCVNTSEVGIVENLGKFEGLVKPGLNCIMWPCKSIVGTISTRVQQLDVKCETKTLDNVFVQCIISVQYQALLDRIYDAYYKLSDHKGQIRSYIYDALRSTLPKMTLDGAFEAKDDIAVAVKENLGHVMSEYGYQIVQVLVTDIEPDRRVRAAMNEINSSKRLKEAASNRAEADKIMQVKAAEAEAEGRYLSGVGVSRQRKAIISGLRDSISEFSSQIPGASARDAMQLLLLTQYFDALKDIGVSSGAKTVFLPADDKSMQSMFRDGILEGNAAA